MTDEAESRHVVRLACGHEALEVVRAGGTPTPVGNWFPCHECGQRKPIIETFEVAP
jgi:hypothetical protein